MARELRVSVGDALGQDTKAEFEKLRANLRVMGAPFKLKVSVNGELRRPITADVTVKAIKCPKCNHEF